MILLLIPMGPNPKKDVYHQGHSLKHGTQMFYVSKEILNCTNMMRYVTLIDIMLVKVLLCIENMPSGEMGPACSRDLISLMMVLSSPESGKSRRASTTLLRLAWRSSLTLQIAANQSRNPRELKTQPMVAQERINISDVVDPRGKVMARNKANSHMTREAENTRKKKGPKCFSSLR